MGMVCRDGSATYASGRPPGAPDAIRIGDRWHIRDNLVAAVEKTVTAEKRALQRHSAVHCLLRRSVGLLECTRRLACRPTPSNATPASPPPRICGGLRPTGAAWSILTSTTCAAAWRNNPTSRPPACSPRSAPRATPAAPTRWSATSGQGRAEPDRLPPAPWRLVTWLTSKPETCLPTTAATSTT